MINLGWQGTFEILVNGEKIATIENRVMDDALNKIANILTGTAPNLEIKYLAVGTSNAPVTNTQTQLGAEFFRTPPVSAPVLANTGEVATEFILLDTEAVGNIEEIGIFCGSTATSTANSGFLLSRILYKKTKTISEEITIRRNDKVVRA